MGSWLAGFLFYWFMLFCVFKQPLILFFFKAAIILSFPSLESLTQILSPSSHPEGHTASHGTPQKRGREGKLEISQAKSPSSARGCLKVPSKSGKAMPCPGPFRSLQFHTHSLTSRRAGVTFRSVGRKARVRAGSWGPRHYAHSDSPLRGGPGMWVNRRQLF